MRLQHEILKAALKAKCLTVRSLTARLQVAGVDAKEGTVQHYFTGRRSMPRDRRMLVEICKQLDVELAEIGFGEPTKAQSTAEDLALQQFRRLSQDQQDAILAMMKTMQPKEASE